MSTCHRYSQKFNPDDAYRHVIVTAKLRSDSHGSWGGGRSPILSDNVNFGQCCIHDLLLDIVCQDIGHIIISQIFRQLKLFGSTFVLDPKVRSIQVSDFA